MNEKRTVATVESIGFSIASGIKVTLSDRQYTHYIKPDQLKHGGKNCEIADLVIGSKIEFDCGVHPATRDLTNVIILSDGIREVDTEGNLIKW